MARLSHDTRRMKMKDKEMAEEYVDTLLAKDDAELDKFLDEYLGDLRLTKKQAGAILGIIKGVGIGSYLAGLEAGSPKWHKLDWEKDYPKSDRLVRVRTKTGREYICETYDYMPAEDEIGYGTILTQFEQLDGDWVDDNEIKYWCYIEPFKE